MKLRNDYCRLLGLAIAMWLIFGPARITRATNVLFHGANVDATFGDDAAVLSHLQSLFGADNVQYMQADMAATDGSSAMGFDAIVISSTFFSTTLRDVYEDTPVGVLSWEQALTRLYPGEFHLSTWGRTATTQTQIDIVDPTHPLAAGLSGTVTVFSTARTMSLGTGVLGPGVSKVAAPTSAPGDHAIMAADVGDLLLGDGSPGNPTRATGRRVMFFLEDQNFRDLTPEGLALFDAAVQWVAIPEPSSLILAAVGLPSALCFVLRSRFGGGRRPTY